MTWEACGRGICAAEEGHEGSCAAASGWADKVRVKASKWGYNKRGYRTWKAIGDGRAFVYTDFPSAMKAANQLAKAMPITTVGLISVVPDQ